LNKATILFYQVVNHFVLFDWGIRLPTLAHDNYSSLLFTAGRLLPHTIASFLLLQS